MDELLDYEGVIIENADFWQLLIRFAFNLLVVGGIVRLLYYPQCKRRDYFFTFIILSISIFLMIFLLGSVKIKIGFALGLFAIFGIMRYRTEQMPVREMTYMFAIIAISVINALSYNVDWSAIIATNLLFVACIWICESDLGLKHISSKLVKYDRIDLIVPEKREELIADLEKRLGLKVLAVEVGGVDFLKDCAIIKVSYEPEGKEINTTDYIGRMPR